MTIQQAFALAIQHHQSGRLGEAESLYRQILSVQPNHPDALHLLGVIAGQVGQHELAVDLIRRAVAAVPGRSDYHNNLGMFLQKQGKLDDAIACFQRAVEINPDFPEAHNNQGMAWTDKGEPDRVIACCRRALELKPEYAEAHYNLGNALRKKGQLDEAIGCYQRALVFKPDCLEAHYCLGEAWMDKDQSDQAAICFQRAVEIKPDYAEAHNNLGNAWMDQGYLDQAIACYQRTLEIKPDYSRAYFNLGSAMSTKGQSDQAAAFYQRALEIQPDHPHGRNSLGNVWKDKGQLNEAMACYRQALELDPQFVKAHDNLLLAMLYHPDFDARSLFIEGRRWNDQRAEPLRQFIRLHENDRSSNRKLRIGYVSPDFRNHAVARFVLPLLARHDHSAFEAFCYAQVRRPDEMTARLQSHADIWRNIVGRSDEQVAEMIRQDQIDILVDLALHTAHNRLLVLARKPAPVQVTFAGYPGSTGLETIDYRLTDPYLDPPDLDDSCYSEKSVRLPATFWCNDAMGAEPPVNPLPADSNGYVTFGCLNNFCKVNDGVLSLWAKVLNANNGSKLLLRAPEGSSRQRVQDRLGKEGIAAGRVQFAAMQPELTYLQTYHGIDIGLDTWPYNGHATSFDSFWMGVPVITLVGRTVVGRAGLSQLTNLGLSELIAHTPDEYVRIATDLAGDLPRLRELRSTFRQRMQGSPLMDAAGFVRGVEDAYRAMWRNWCAQQSVRA